jgi:predicted dehydrogenase
MVGLGFMGATHLAAYQKIPDISIGGVVTQSNRSLADHLAQAGGNLNRPATKFDFAGVHQYNDWRELLKDPSYDLIDICSPTDLHAEVAITALSSGKHVFCEKPMALTAAECDRMIEAATKNNRVLMIGHVLRFWPEYRVLHDFVKQGKYGKVREARLERSCGVPDWSHWLPVEARSGGALIDLLVHDIDQALSLFGVPEHVAAVALGEHDAVKAVLSYPEGVEVKIEGGWLQSGSPFYMGFEARTEKALLELSGEGFFLDDGSGRKKAEPPVEDAYDREIGYFIECCRTGASPDVCPPEQSAQAIKIALLLRESRSRKGETIKCLV